MTSVSACGFATLTTDTNAVSVLWVLADSSTPTGAIQISTTADGTSLWYQESGSADVSIGTLTVGTPFFWGVTRTGTAVKLFLRNLTSATMTPISHTASDNVTTGFMAVSFDVVPFVGTMSGVKVWGAALTDAEMDRESRSIAPVRSANLNGWWPMVHSTLADCIKDYSGNARDWTATGTPTIGQGQPVPWGGKLIYVLPQYVQPTASSGERPPIPYEDAEWFGPREMLHAGAWF
jgi:hypothetical protein